MNAPRSHATSWARVRLLAGESPSRHWEITSESGETRLSLGADATMGWRIEAAGVRPHHVELYWNGRELWVGNAANDYSVRVDGEPVREWMAIQGRARVEFANAVLDIEYANVATTSAGEKPAADLSRWDGADAKTIIQPEASRIEPPSQRGVFIETATQVLSSERGASPAHYTVDESTRIHENRPSTPAMSFDEITRNPPTPQRAPVPTSPAPPAQTYAAPRATHPEAPAAAQDSPFAAPPPPEAEPAVKALHQITERFVAMRAGRSMAVPPRTWLLIAAVVVMGNVALMQIAGKRRAAEQAAAEAAAAASRPPEPPPMPARRADAIQTSAAMSGTASIELVKQAANALFAGRREDALRLYRELSAREPGSDAYKVIVTVLERQSRPCSQTAGVQPCTP